MRLLQKASCSEQPRRKTLVQGLRLLKAVDFRSCLCQQDRKGLEAVAKHFEVRQRATQLELPCYLRLQRFLPSLKLQDRDLGWLRKTGCLRLHQLSSMQTTLRSTCEERRQQTKHRMTIWRCWTRTNWLAGCLRESYSFNSRLEEKRAPLCAARSSLEE
jgi:hypothetical protein